MIDRDLGKSGSSSAARDGFQQLVSEVALGKAGIVMGLEVSRLARNSADWHRLIELCALTATLILDEDGIYDPAGFNDRLLLGLKGTMSEAELHILKARMRGGQLNKARRGELEMVPPVGLVYQTDGSIGLDPDVQVQSALRMVFETFERTGSAVQTVRFFREQGSQFPRRLRTGANKGDLLWATPQHSRILQVLHNPRYAGAFVYGRTRTRHRLDGGVSVVKVARADWQFVMPGMHQGYIDWERFEANQRRLTDNAGGIRWRTAVGAGARGTGVASRARAMWLVWRTHGGALQPRAWQYGPDFYLSGERGAPRRKNVSNGARQDRRCGSCCAADRDDDADEAGRHSGSPA